MHLAFDTIHPTLSFHLQKSALGRNVLTAFFINHEREPADFAVAEEEGCR
jgi:hypothetical protein